MINNGGDKIDLAVEWFKENIPLYDVLTNKVADLIKEVLEEKDISYYIVEERTKKLESFKNKLETGFRKNFKEMQDLAGIRIITYIESESTKIGDLLKELFEIDEKRSYDRSKALGVDKMGYRSFHYVASFSKERCTLPEYKKFEGMFFEIQVRTILQHAWAEIQHDKNYKFTGVLPEEIQRRFSVLAGILELTDREFNQTSKDLDLYSQNVLSSTEKGNLKIAINTSSLRMFLINKFKELVGKEIEPVFGPKDSAAKEIIKELKIMGLKTLLDLDNVIKSDFIDKWKSLREKSNFAGLLRDILILHDSEKYFKDAWRHKWSSTGEDNARFLRAFGIDMFGIAERYGINIENSP